MLQCSSVGAASSNHYIDTIPSLQRPNELRLWSQANRGQIQQQPYLSSLPAPLRCWPGFNCLLSHYCRFDTYFLFNLRLYRSSHSRTDRWMSKKYWRTIQQSGRKRVSETENENSAKCTTRLKETWKALETKRKGVREGQLCTGHRKSSCRNWSIKSYTVFDKQKWWQACTLTMNYSK